MSNAPHSTTTVIAAELRTGDTLAALGDVVFPHYLDAATAPTQVTAAHDADGSGEYFVVHTSTHPPLYTYPSAPCEIVRHDAVTAQTPLLLTRRDTLHTAVAGLGYPVIRRSPISGDAHPLLDATDWSTAPVVIVDGYLSYSTLRDLVMRPDLLPRANVLMVTDNVDRPIPAGRARVLGATIIKVLPYEADDLKALFAAVANGPAAQTA